MWISAGIRTMSLTTAAAVFLLYSVMNGLLFSSIFIVYTGESIALTFFITAGTFAAMSIYGYTTKADLSKIGSIAIMALIGILIASLVNYFLESETLYWIISYVGVAVFVALVAYDTQKLKDMAIYGFDGETAARKMSIFGALTLYLDFINLFLFLLRLFGSRRN
jgi:FtsH-binding integral membrane protein